MLKDTIVALSTAPFESAIAIIRLSGKDAYKIMGEIFSKPIKDPDHQKIYHGKIKDGDNDVDDVIVTLYKGPKSFTGEDIVEISCHGSLIVINKILELCISKGARSARRGEFSERAFLNGKIDLLQAESINDLIHATNESGAKVALQGLKGAVSNKIKELETELIDLISQIEVNIDYPEYEDIEQLTNEILLPRIDSLKVKMKRTLDEAQTGRLLRDGIKVAIIGKPNAGKSSLLNALLEEDKAIVTDIAGTTRDVVEGRTVIGGLPFLFLDTAGIRNPTDKVEKLGVEKSKKVIEEADIVLQVIDGSEDSDKDLMEIKDKPQIIVINKTDLGNKTSIKGVEISALNKDIDQLKERLVSEMGISIKEVDQYAVLSNARQIGLMSKAYQSLMEAEDACKRYVPIDLVFIDLNLALDAVSEIIGTKTKTDIEKEIFSRFCVGK